VRDLHAREVLAKQPAPPQASQVFPFKPREPVVTHIDRRRAERADADRSNVVALRPAAQPSADEAQPLAEAAASPPRPRAGLTARLERVTAPPPRAAKQAAASTAAAQATEPRYHLTLDSDVVDGPSIGPKTAERLTPHGVKTVRDLMRAEPAALAVILDTRHITAETIADWQDQARLVCTVPGLRGTHAQLLVGAGYRSAEAVAEVDADKLCADVLAYAASKEGQRLLRNGDPPDLEKIKGWLAAAQSVKAA
jgi:predicted flap endonuclease-1-like 5' DNA nuclease